LPPSDYCDYNHTPPPRDDSALSTPEDYDCFYLNTGSAPGTPRAVHSVHGTPSQHHDAANNATPSKYTMNNNNYTPNSSSNGPNYNYTRNDDDSSDASDAKTWSDASNSQSPTYCFEELPEALAIAMNPQHETTAIYHAETKTNNDESSSVTRPNKASASSAGEANHEESPANACLDKASYKQPVEDYRYFFHSEENSIEDDEEFIDDQEFEDDEKENEPPAKFVKMNMNSDKCNVHNM